MIKKLKMINPLSEEVFFRPDILTRKREREIFLKKFVRFTLISGKASPWPFYPRF